MSIKKYPTTDYTFGEFSGVPGKQFFWNPDSKDILNFHMLLAGGSGAGKTTLILSIIKYLAYLGKHIFLFDFQGDMIIYDDKGNKMGNYLNFTAWGSEYGLSPFEFDTGVTEPELRDIIEKGGITFATEDQIGRFKNSGPKVQVERLIEIYKKNFHSSMGEKQEIAFKNLFEDTYISKGFVYNNINTWLNDLPTLEDTLDIIKKIESYSQSNMLIIEEMTIDLMHTLQGFILYRTHLEKEIKKRGLDKEGEKDEEQELGSTKTLKLKKEASEEEMNRLSRDDAEDIPDEDEKPKEYESRTLIPKNPSYAIEAIPELDNETLLKEFSYAKDATWTATETYKEKLSLLYRKSKKEAVMLESWFSSRGIDINKYMTKDMLKAIDSLKNYITALVKSEKFHSRVMPVKAGLNIINVAGLDVAVQRFIVDIILGKIFKSCKIKGNYADRDEKERERGALCNTFVCIDEVKLIVGNSHEKNNPYSYLNRTATEARKYGLGMIIAGQSATHFPSEFIKNFATQVILNTSIADSKAVKEYFGLKDGELAFTQAKKGNALIKYNTNFVQVKIPDKRAVA